MVAAMVVQMKVKMLVVVDLVVAQAQQKTQAAILDLQIQIVIQPDKEILVEQQTTLLATEVVVEVVLVKPDKLQMVFLEPVVVDMVFHSLVSQQIMEHLEQIQEDISVVVDQQDRFLLQEQPIPEVKVAVEMEKVMILSAVMEPLTPEAVEEVQVVDLLTPLVELVVLVFVSFVISLNSHGTSLFL
tara:strand:+ start:232 stop:789 length:558 start_codon:yes stop_codon:yes gene_type:complete